MANIVFVVLVTSGVPHRNDNFRVVIQERELRLAEALCEIAAIILCAAVFASILYHDVSDARSTRSTESQNVG